MSATPAASSNRNVSPAWSGTSAHGGDATNLEGQYPPGGWGDAIFGGAQPSGTGAPGSAGSRGTADPTNEPGQLDEGLSGLGPADTAQTGAPGAATTPISGGGGTGISYTLPGAGIGPNMTATASDDLDGTRDSTQANDQGYGTGGPQIPGIAEPVAGGKYQPGSGRVLRGGRDIRP